MGDRTRGIYRKFRVTRTDGESRRTVNGRIGKHYGCRYFVLDVDHDRHAIPALKAYAESCKDEYSPLAADVLALVAERGAKPLREGVD